MAVTGGIGDIAGDGDLHGHETRRGSPRRRGCCRSAAGSGTSPAARSPGRPSSTGSSAWTRRSPRRYETFVEHVHPDDRERVVGLIAERRRAPASPLEFEHRIVRHDGAVRMLHCRGEVVSRDGRPVRVFGICQDVTERKRIQDEVAIERELAFSVDAAAHARAGAAGRPASGSAGTAASRSGRPGPTPATTPISSSARLARLRHAARRRSRSAARR